MAYDPFTFGLEGSETPTQPVNRQVGGDPFSFGLNTNPVTSQPETIKGKPYAGFLLDKLAKNEIKQPTIPKKGASAPNPVVGENYFLLNAFPIKQKDNISTKIAKGAGNVFFSLLDAPAELLRKASIQGGSLLTGHGIQTNLPKNTSFVNDILPKGASNTLNQFAQDHPVLGGLTKMSIETLADPSVYLGGAIGKLQNAKLSPIEQLAAKNKLEFPTLPKTKTVDNLSSPLSNNKVMQAAKGEPTHTLTASVDNPLIPAGFKERKFADNVRSSQIATPEIKANLDENLLTYKPITNKGTHENAVAKVSENVDTAKSDFYSTDAKKGLNADDVALGEALISKAIKSGNTTEANTLIADLAEKLTTAGQAVQAASIFKRLSPEGMLLYAQRTVNKVNRNLGGKAPKIKLTDEESKAITDGMEKVRKLPDGGEKDIELAKVLKIIANKEPATFGEKIKGLQRIAMLLNPKTMIRNTLGNAIFGTVDNISNTLATPLDKLVSLKTGQRTTALPNPLTQLKSGLQGAKDTIQDAKLGIDTYNIGTQFELPNKRIFKNPVLNKFEQGTKVGLQLGDRPFYQAAYDDVLRQQMKLAKVSEPTPEMIEQATNIAKQRTYQDVNAITKMADGLRDALNRLGTKDFGLGNVVLPFTKTPANILKRAAEYSPIGLERTVRETINLVKKNGKFDQKAFVDSIARSATGSGIIMAGYALAEKGVLTGSANKDKDVAAFEKNLGKNDFAVKLGDKYYTYDWAQPVSLAIAIGADMYLQGMSKKDAENAVVEAVKSGGATLVKQSFLQGVQRLFGGYSPMDGLENTIMNVPTQFVPTLFKQFAQVGDPTTRSTYDPSKEQTMLNTLKAKIPGLSNTLQPKLDTFGKEVQNYQGKNNLFNIFAYPGYTTEFKPNQTESELLRLYDSVGDAGIFPKVAPKSVTAQGQTITLTAEEYAQFQRTMGQKTEQDLQRVVNANYSDEKKVKKIKSVIDDSYDAAKEELFKNRGIKLKK